MGKRRYITFKVDEDLPDVAILRSSGRAREPLGVRCGRCMRFCGFCCVCTCTFFQALAPWMLSVIEVGTLLLLLLLLFLPHHPPGPYTFEFDRSLEDLVLLGGLRAAVICGTYAYGRSRFRFRPYLYTSYVTGCAGLVYVVTKACLYAYPLAWLPPAAMMVTFGTFSWLHILAARYTVTWYRRRGQLGLLQSSWQPPQNIRRSVSAASLGAGTPAWLEDSTADVPAELLADADSQFLDVDGLVVHYKEATPSAAACIAGLSLNGGSQPLAQPDTATLAVKQHQLQQAASAMHADGVATAAAGAAAAGKESHTAAGMGPQLPAVAEISVAATAAGIDSAAGVRPDVAIVLIHGFGGGVFAWRHMQQPLADAVGVRVIAFDRPGFGLTARPEIDDNDHSSQPAQPQAASSSSTRGVQQPLLPSHSQQGQQQHHTAAANPYSIDAQARLTLRLCELLGLRRVLLVGHADGCVVAAHAAAAACRRQQQQHHHHHHHPPPQHRPVSSGGRSSSSRLGQPTYVNTGLENQGSIDFSWMGSLGKGSCPLIPEKKQDPTPRMIARTQAMMQGHSAGSEGSTSAAAAASTQPMSSPAGLSSPSSSSSKQQREHWASATPDSALGYDVFSPETHLVHRALEDVREVEQTEGGGSTASSLSFQSMLQAAGRNSSRQSLAEGGEGGYASSAPPSEGRHSSPGVSEAGYASSVSINTAQEVSEAGGTAAEEDRAGSPEQGGPSASQQQQRPPQPQQQLQEAGSLVLKPPLPQSPFSASSSSSETHARAGTAQPNTNGVRAPRGLRRSGSGSHGSGGGSSPWGSSSGAAVEIQVVGLVLLHPNLSGHQVPAFTRLLAGSSLGRSMLRPLLRSEVGVVTNRRAWHNPDLITREVLQLYKRPLRVQGWDAALLATSRATGSLSQKQVLAQFAAVRHLPALLLTGEFDRIATPGKVAGVAALLTRAQRAVVPACGHLSHEEAPQQLLELLVPFCRQRLNSTAASAAQTAAAGGDRCQSPSRMRDGREPGMKAVAGWQ